MAKGEGVTEPVRIEVRCPELPCQRQFEIEANEQSVVTAALRGRTTPTVLSASVSTLQRVGHVEGAVGVV